MLLRAIFVSIVAKILGCHSQTITFRPRAFVVEL